MMVSVVVPVYNSSPSLGELYTRLRQVLDAVADDWEIILVDDRSGDDSFQVMQELRKSDPRVKLIRLERNSGQHNATLCGLTYAQGDCLITIDDDLQHPPEEIPSLLQGIQAGRDVVFGIPRHKQQDLYRNWGSWLIDILIRSVFPGHRGIKRSSFRALTRELADRMVVHAETPVYMAALILSQARSPGNVEVEHQRRKYGRSNYGILKTVTMTRDLLINHSHLPLRILGGLWLVFIPTGLVLLRSGRPGPGSSGIGTEIIIWLSGSALTLATAGLAFQYWSAARRRKTGDRRPYIIDEMHI